MIDHFLTGDACIGDLYGHPMVEAALGGSLHPGGLALTRTLCEDISGHVLDVGCGKGASAQVLVEQGCHVTGIDLSARNLAQARMAVPSATFIQGDLDAVTGSFDAVLTECTLCLHADPAETLAKLHQRLRPGGTLLLSDVTVEAPARSFRSAAGFMACLGGAMPHDRLIEAVERAGFTIDHSSKRPELIHEVRDRIHARIDVEAVLTALDDDGLRSLVTQAEAALVAGHLGYAVVRATRS